MGNTASEESETAAAAEQASPPPEPATPPPPPPPPPPPTEEEAAAAEERRPSTWQIIRGGYNDLVNAIIRPPRAEYEMGALGPQRFRKCDLYRAHVRPESLRRRSWRRGPSLQRA